jgi:hypothetical protein
MAKSDQKPQLRLWVQEQAKKKPPSEPHTATLPLCLFGNPVSLRGTILLIYLARESSRTGAEEHHQGWFLCPGTNIGGHQVIPTYMRDRCIGELAAAQLIQTRRRGARVEVRLNWAQLEAPKGPS